MGYCRWFGSGGWWLWVDVRILWVVVGRCEWFDGKNRLLWVVVQYSGWFSLGGLLVVVHCCRV